MTTTAMLSINKRSAPIINWVAFAETLIRPSGVSRGPVKTRLSELATVAIINNTPTIITVFLF
jgi:hypothetical protein